MKWCTKDFALLRSIVIAEVTENGQLIEANEGFMRLTQVPGKSLVENRVDHLFRQPDFATLLKIAIKPDGEIYQGLLTLGEYTGRTHSILARIRREAGRLYILAEFDIDELERVNDTVLELNHQYANAQLALAQANIKLLQQQQKLEKLVAELTAEKIELKQAQSQLVQADKMASIGLLAAGVAHEINSPIGYIFSNLGTLEKYVQDTINMLNLYEQAESKITDSAIVATLNEAKTELDIVFMKVDIFALMAESREGIIRVKKIVQDLKDFSHREINEEWHFTDLHKCLDSTLNIINNEIKYKADLIREYGDIPPVECFPSQLNQVFMNLLVNAAHAIEERGTIKISTGRHGDEVWICVADTGKGVAPEHVSKIFDPFFTTKPVGEGTGLGLSLSYRIVQNHHGRIEVQSEPGKGATFCVWLPITQTLPLAITGHEMQS
jgi:signal transduction histidine kinase